MFVGGPLRAPSKTKHPYRNLVPVRRKLFCVRNRTDLFERCRMLDPRPRSCAHIEFCMLCILDRSASRPIANGAAHGLTTVAATLLTLWVVDAADLNSS